MCETRRNCAGSSFHGGHRGTGGARGATKLFVNEEFHSGHELFPEEEELLRAALEEEEERHGYLSLGKVVPR